MDALLLLCPRPLDLRAKCSQESPDNFVLLPNHENALQEAFPVGDVLQVGTNDEDDVKAKCEESQLNHAADGFWKGQSRVKIVQIKVAINLFKGRSLLQLCHLNEAPSKGDGSLNEDHAYM